MVAGVFYFKFAPLILVPQKFLEQWIYAIVLPVAESLDLIGLIFVLLFKAL